MMKQQESERYYFEKFRRDYRLPAGEMVYGDRPDAIIQGRRRIGIEITNFFREDGSFSESEQVQQKLRRTVVSEAQRIFSVGCKKGIEMTFDFDKDRPIQKTGKLAKEIAKLADELQGSDTGVVDKEVYKDIPELSYVYLNAEEYDDPKWRLVHFTMGRMMSRDRLLEIVRLKEAIVPGYKRCILVARRDRIL
jgi:hypothetical protein